MKFFFPDSSDLVDPSFDFERETRSVERVRQRDDLYAHEVFDVPPFDGILVSKAIVDGTANGGGRYSLAQRHRLLRSGVRRFFRLDEREGSSHLETIGDCGAFSYVREKIPPYTVDSVLEFYDLCGFDYGLSVDHVILGFDDSLDGGLPGVNVPPPEWAERLEITLELARDFWKTHRGSKLKFTPVGVAQGYSPQSYARAVEKLQKIGYKRIAIGGVVPLKTHEILASLAAVNEVRKPSTRLHLLGVTRISEVSRFAGYGVESFDSTSPLRQAFKDDKDNYYTRDRTYQAIRIPQVEGNPKLMKQIRSGEVDHDEARRLEQACLSAFRRFEAEECGSEELLKVLAEYEELQGGGVDRTARYQEVLEERPWRQCECEICKELGFHVILFRGAERNRRRGFHNLHAFCQRLRREVEQGMATVSEIAEQGAAT